MDWCDIRNDKHKKDNILNQVELQFIFGMKLQMRASALFQKFCVRGTKS